ncbi:MAG: DUF4383 domain-containing protein [Minisyncoccota bacterium]
MAKTLTLIFGVILVLLGLLGFISNPLIGANALFVADAAHNLIHIILGAILLAVALWASESSVLWLKLIGVATFLLGLIGIFTVPAIGGTLLGIAGTNGASNWLNLIAGILIFSAGKYGTDDGYRGAPPMQSSSPQREM